MLDAIKLLLWSVAIAAAVVGMLWSKLDVVICTGLAMTWFSGLLCAVSLFLMKRK